MAGLLDFLTTDPEQQRAITQGLLSGAFGAMAGRGSRLQAWGQGGLAGLQGYSNSLDRSSMERQQQAEMERRKLLDQLTQYQVQQAQRENQIAALPQQFAQPARIAPEMDARDIGTPGAAPTIPAAFDTQGYLSALRGMDPMRAAQAESVLNPAAKPIVSRPGDVARDATGKILWQNPDNDPAKQSPIGQLISEMNALPPGDPRRAIYQQAIQKASTHTPPVSVSYGAPVAGVDPQGNSVFFQPSKDGRSAPAIVQGVKPAPQNRDTKLPAELQRMQIAGDAMGQLLNDYEGMLKKYNPRDPMVQANPAVRAEMQSLKRNLELQFKELQALGALAGPDIEIMRQALSDPFSMQGAYYGREGLQAQIKQARTLLKNRSDAVMRSQGKPDAPKTEDNDPLGIRK